MIDLESYQRVWHKFSIVDCAIRSKDIFMFLGSEILTDDEIIEYEEGDYDLSTRPKKIITFLRNGDETGKQWFQSHLIGWYTSRIGATNKPKSHSITIARDDMINRVYTTGSGPAYEDCPITHYMDGGISRGPIERLKTIGGWLYFCGGRRNVGKRIDKGQWQSITESMPVLNTGDTIRNITESGFSDIDGFSESDIYAAGGHGDVWNFNGTEWKPIPFPSNQTLESLCCGGDGNVYISGYQGLTYMGRGDNWKKINDGGINLGWRDMVWHGDRVWCTNDYGVWTIHNGIVSRADLPSEISTCAGHLYVNDGVMLLAGANGAAFCEDGKWTLLFNTFTMDKLLEISQHES